MAAQLVNFLIVVAVLWWWALKPLMKLMRERNQEISQGLADAKAAAQRLDQAEHDIKGKLQETKLAAAKILEEAKKNADQARQLSLDKTKQEVENLIAKTKQQIQGEKENMVQQARKEVAALIVEALTKVLSEGVTKELDKKYIDKVLKEFK